MNPMQTNNDDDDSSGASSAATSSKSYETTRTAPPTAQASSKSVDTTPRASVDNAEPVAKKPELSRMPSEKEIKATEPARIDSRASEASRPSQAIRASDMSPSVSSLSSISFSGSRQTSVASPPEKSGFLEKLSPKMLAGWQKRYFVLKAPGILLYYGSVRDCLSM
jgi:hypothetical protein